MKPSCYQGLFDSPFLCYSQLQHPKIIRHAMIARNTCVYVTLQCGQTGEENLITDSDVANICWLSQIITICCKTPKCYFHLKQDVNNSTPLG